MNKYILIFLNILKRVMFGIIILFFILYFSLWILFSNWIPKELKIMYNQDIESYFSDEQYNIITFSLSDNKGNKFKWYPFIVDIFVQFNNVYKNRKSKNINSIAYMATSRIALEYFHNNIGKYGNMEWHMMNYGLERYIILKNDYKKSIDIITGKGWMGLGIFGFKNASEYYYNKEIKELTNEELISLRVLMDNPGYYKIGSEENKIRTERILNEYGN